MPSKTCLLLLSASSALAHIQLIWPYALRSTHNPENPQSIVDYSMTSPLASDGSNFPCKGYQNDGSFKAITTYVPGSTYNISLAGSATHTGGSCQISLSYDNGATFRVIKSMIGGCPLTKTYDFTVPSYAPSGDALLAWSWQNKSGNREFYMNCAQVAVSPGESTPDMREETNSFDSLPYIWKANVPAVNDCKTAEGESPVYPNPGPDVIYDDGMSSADPAHAGTCDSPTPYGPTYKDDGNSTPSPVESTPIPGETTPLPQSSTASTVSNMTATMNSSTITMNSSTITMNSSTITMNSSTITMNSLTSTMNSSATTPNAASRTPNQNAIGDDIATETKYKFQAKYHFNTQVHFEDSATETYNHGRIIVAPTSTLSTVTVTAKCPGLVKITVAPDATSPPTGMRTTTRRPISPVASQPAPSGPLPPYARGDINAMYLPCVPGSYLCTSRTSFVTCNYNDGTVDTDEIWVYSTRYEQHVAAGMECLPMLAPYSASTGYTSQQNGTRTGSYRDDRYVRAQPEGPCRVDGGLQCTHGGQQFSVCDQGGWVPMGPVAVGTVCQGRSIVASG